MVFIYMNVIYPDCKSGFIETVCVISIRNKAKTHIAKNSITNSSQANAHAFARVYLALFVCIVWQGSVQALSGD